MTTEHVKNIPCLQYYSLGHSYLLVSDCIQAIIPFKDFKADSLVSWHMGYLDYNGHQVPLINLQGQQAQTQAVDVHERIMVIQGVYRDQHPLIGFIVGQFTRPVTISSAQTLRFDGPSQGHLYPVKSEELVAKLVDVEQLTKLLIDEKIL